MDFSVVKSALHGTARVDKKVKVLIVFALTYDIPLYLSVSFYFTIRNLGTKVSKSSLR